MVDGLITVTIHSCGNAKVISWQLADAPIRCNLFTCRISTFAGSQFGAIHFHAPAKLSLSLPIISIPIYTTNKDSASVSEGKGCHCLLQKVYFTFDRCQNKVNFFRDAKLVPFRLLASLQTKLFRLSPLPAPGLFSWFTNMAGVRLPVSQLTF